MARLVRVRRTSSARACGCSKGSCRSNGQTLLDIPAGKFVHFEIAAELGSGQAGTWTLTVTLPGQPPREFENLAFGSPDVPAADLGRLHQQCECQDGLLRRQSANHSRMAVRGSRGDGMNGINRM